MGGMGQGRIGWPGASLLLTYIYLFSVAFSGGISFYSVFLSRAFQILLEATGDQSGAGPVSILISLLPPHAPPTIIASFPFLPSTPCVFSPVLTLFS
jgi:hypothetical protein